MPVDRESATSAADRSLPLTPMRRAIGRAMSLSATIPQFTLQRDVQTAFAAEHRAAFDAEARISLTDQLVAAVSRALSIHPRMNSILAESEKRIVELAAINVGIAYAIPDGLIAPPIMNANERTLPELSRERRAAAEAAAEGTVSAAALAEVTFTVSNLGPMGIKSFTALVVPPQAAILAVGATDAEGMMPLSLSCDHRIVDGAPAAEFLGSVVELLEQPTWMDSIVSKEAGTVGR